MRISLLNMSLADREGAGFKYIFISAHFHDNRQDLERADEPGTEREVGLPLLESNTIFEFAPFLGERASSFNHSHFCFHARAFYYAKTCLGHPEKPSHRSKIEKKERFFLEQPFKCVGAT